MAYRPPMPMPQQTSVPRDLTAHDQALANVNNEASTWAGAVAASDQALSDLQAAQSAFDQAVSNEAQARASYESAQNAYQQAYGSVPKEDTLTP